MLIRGKHKENKLKQLKDEANEKELIGCTFGPEITQTQKSSFLGLRKRIAMQINHNLDMKEVIY